MYEVAFSLSLWHIWVLHVLRVTKFKSKGISLNRYVLLIFIPVVILEVEYSTRAVVLPRQTMDYKVSQYLSFCLFYSGKNSSLSS